MKSFPSLLSGSRRRPLLRLVAAGFVRGAVSFAVIALMAHAGSAAVDPLTIALGLIGAASVLAFVRAVETVESERLGQAYVRALRRRMFEALLAAGSFGLTGFSRGSLWVRLTGDLNGLRRWIALGMSRVIAGVPMLVVLVLSLLWLDVRLAGLVAGAIVLIVLVAALLQSRLLEREKAVRRERARLAGGVEKMLRELAAADEAVSDPSRLARLKRRSSSVAQSSVERAHVHAGMRAVAEFAPLAVTAAATFLIVARDPGVLLSGLALAGLVAGPLRDLSRAWEMRQGYLVACANVRPILELSPVVPVSDADPAPSLSVVRFHA